MADRLRSFLASTPSATESSSDDSRSHPATAPDGPPPQDENGGSKGPAPPKKFPKGVVLGADGKPCRSCTSFASWASMTGKAVSPSASTSTQPPDDCPADVEALGRSSWTFLHTLAANYPTNPSQTQQGKTSQFLRLFGDFYPCAPCAEDFRAWMTEEGNAPKVRSRDELGRWLCEAHNAVNEKLGKERFECADWEKRWRTGDWGNGRCG